ncbi:ring-cleaving dioxygenase [soil metagenome]
MDLTGIHHLTAISADIAGNKRFYTETLGMRLVKRSVNQDDVSAYHLFYADAKGNPGTDITFFDWPVPSERRGTNAIIRTSLLVPPGTIASYWNERLAANGGSVTSSQVRDDRESLDFGDPEGQRLTLVEFSDPGIAMAWDQSLVPAAMQIRGLGPIELSVPELEPTANVLLNVMNFRHCREYRSDRGEALHVFEMHTGGPTAEIHVAVQPDLPRARQGAGGVHHVAFRTPDSEYDAWAARLNELGVPNSGKVDRFWFRSLYFREPNGILFEIASEGPGFAVDEDEATLGEKVVLPPFLERRRAEIVAGLKPID